MDTSSMSNHNYGNLEIILGCMRSGKTTELIRKIKRCNCINKTVLVVSHCSDTRYGKNVVSSHDKVQIDCLSLPILCSVFENDMYKNADYVFIEEGQFFDDLVDFCSKAVDIDCKNVVVSALDGDFQRKPFRVIADLIPLADDYIKLTALCQICKDGTAGIFSKRICGGTQQKMVGADEYLSVCRKHYNDKN